MVKVGVIGHTGRLGKPLVEILKDHPNTEIIFTESRKEGSKGNLSDAELVFLSLPYGESEQYLSRLSPNQRVIDLSVDHRGKDGWVYGLPEMNKEEIKKAQRIANPGCYATSIILGLLPLKGRVSDVNVSSTSGISGAGEEVKPDDNFYVYKHGRQHPQIAEIEKSLGLENLLFVPQCIETSDRGIVSTVFATFRGKEDLLELYKDFYKSSVFVDIISGDIETKKVVETKNVVRTNKCSINISRYDDRIIVISAIDNLIKGGSGQAVQNFNLMCGFDEKNGLL